MINLSTPHISLGLAVDEAIAILQGFGNPVQVETNGERSFRVDTPLFNIAVYPEGETVRSVWYDDSIGRDSEVVCTEKIRAYLKRYGDLQNWERRIDNGWMHYWFNPPAHTQMVYGVHKDVIRFNKYRDENS